MTTTIRVFTLAAVAACTLLNAQTALEFAAWKGTYSYVEDGINATGQRYERIGILELDGTGAAVATDVTKTSGGPVSARLTGSYQPMSDGSVEVKLFTTSTTTADDLDETTTTAHSSLKLIAAGQSTWEGLRTDPGVSGVVKVEALAKATTSSLKRYTLIEDGVAQAPYSVLGTFDWSTSQGASATLLVKQSTLESLNANGTAMVNADGLATISLLSETGDDINFRATYMGVPVNKGADWALVRMDAGVLGAARLVAR
ncbi:MAG: hypothetical protein U0R19_23165 [Bryobacteraceae bacterium]